MHHKPASPLPAFGNKADSYDAHALVQKHAAEWLAQWIPSASEIDCLELGAGTGLLTCHLADKFKHLECTDCEPTMVALCKNKFPTATHRVRDAWAVQPDRGQWDLVTASSLLQWAHEPNRVMQHWQKLLKPHGRIIVGFFIEPSLPEMLEVTGGASPLIWRDSSTWQSIFTSAGLEIVRMESDTRRYHYTSALSFWKSIHGTGATISRRMMPSQMMRFFREYELQFRDAQGIYATWTFCRVELQACA